MAELRLLEDIPGYSILQVLRLGPNAAVYAARRDDGSIVALKVLLDPSGADPFTLFRGLRIARMLGEGPAVRELDGGVVSDHPWCALELPEGAPLDVWLTRSGAGLRSRLHVIFEIAMALLTIHRMGVIHRDIQPSHIIVTVLGGVRLLSFGRALTHGQMLPVAVRGVPAIAAPEELVGNRLDERIDVYALGVTARQMLLGSAPWATTPSWFQDRPFSDASPDSSARLSSSLARILDRATATDPDERHPNIAALLDDLRGVRYDVDRYLASAADPDSEVRTNPGDADWVPPPFFGQDSGIVDRLEWAQRSRRW